MKSLVSLALLITALSSFAQNSGNVLNSEEILVSGKVANEGERTIISSSSIQSDDYSDDVEDAQLNEFKSEYQNYKTQTKLSKKKAKILSKVAGQVEKFSDAQEEFIEGAVERQKAINEFAKRKKKNETKLKCIMENANTEECHKLLKKHASTPVEQSVGLTQAAPMRSQISHSQVNQGPFEKIKLLPFAGATSFNGKVEQLETQLTAGLKVESDISSRYALGLGVKYDHLKTTDYANNLSYMNLGYNSVFGRQGREIQYRSFGLDVYGKFFITNTNRFRPFVGAALGYNRATLKYNNNNAYYDQLNALYYGSEEFNTSFVTGALSAGSEVKISANFGLLLEGVYSTGLGRSITSRSSRNGGNSPDQTRLRDLGDEMINSNALSMFFAGVFTF